MTRNQGRAANPPYHASDTERNTNLWNPDVQSAKSNGGVETASESRPTDSSTVDRPTDAPGAGTGNFHPPEPGDPTSFPMLAGLWNDGSHQILLTQHENHLIASCKYTHAQFGDFQWIMAGTVNQMGIMNAELWYVDRPSTLAAVHKHNGTLQADGSILM